MELLIKNIKSKADQKLFMELAKRLGLSSAILSDQDKEDIALGRAIEDGLKTGFVDEKIVMQNLRSKLKK